MTLLLVDDDIEVVEMLQSLLDWSALGYTKILTAAGGPEAVAAVADKPVDLLISDIGMPMMDGYELSLRLKKQNPGMIVIFLTCHEDFDHARQAISVGADDYLLKYALTGNVLRETVTRAVEKQRRLPSPAVMDSRYAAALDESRASFKEQLLYRIVTGAIQNLESVRDKLQLYHIHPPAGPYCLVSFFMDYDIRRLTERLDHTPKAWRYETVGAITDLLRNSQIQDEVFTLGKHILLLHEWPGAVRSFSTAYQHVVAEIRQHAGAAAKAQVQLCISDTYTGLLALKNAVTDLERRSACAFYAPVKSPLLPCEPAFRPMPFTAFNDYYKRFRGVVLEPANFVQEIEQLSAELQKQQYDPAMVRKLFHTFDAYLSRESVRIGGAAQEILLSDMSFQFCIDALHLQYERFQAYRRLPRSLSSNEDINLVLQYIDNHLDQKITLQTAAGHIFKNSSYLSRLFKQHIGMSFTDYLIKKRIEKATELLANSDLTAEEISERIGIDNVSYFYQFYKRETGKTPRSGRQEAAALNDTALLHDNNKEP